jgi:four helix bundle protein
MSRDRTKLDAFRVADDLAFMIYRESRSIRTSDEDLRRQLRRAAISVPANIAEGCGRRSPADYRRFLDIALGSAEETTYLLDLAGRLNLLTGPGYDASRNLATRVVKILQKLLDSVGEF